MARFSKQPKRSLGGDGGCFYTKTRFGAGIHGRKKKAKTEAGRPAKKKSEKEVQAGKEKLKANVALKGEAIKKLKTEKLAQPRVSFVTDKIAHEVARSCIGRVSFATDKIA